MINQKILEAIYTNGPLGYQELSVMTGEDTSEIAFRGIELIMGGLADFDRVKLKFSYVEGAWGISGDTLRNHVEELCD